MVSSSIKNGVNSCNAVNPASLLTISQASEYTGLHPQTIRNKVRQGVLNCYRIGSMGWTRYSQDELAVMCGIEIEQKKKTEKKVAILGRVSSDKQAEYGKSQMKRLRKYVKENYGESKPLEFFEICSAFGNRQALYSCVDSIIDGHVDVLVVEYRDRLSRTSALTNLVKHICKRYGVEIVYVEQSEAAPDSLQSNLEEVLEHCMHLNAKTNGMKSGERRKINVSTECLKRAFELKNSGYSERGIVDILSKEGFKNPRTNKKYERATIGRILRREWTVLSKMYGSPKGRGKTSFDRFASKHISKVSVKSGKNRRNKVSRKRIVEIYNQWCEKNSELPVSNSHITKQIDNLYNPRRITQSDHSVIYEGISLLVSRSR